MFWLAFLIFLWFGAQCMLAMMFYTHKELPETQELAQSIRTMGSGGLFMALIIAPAMAVLLFMKEADDD